MNNPAIRKLFYYFIPHFENQFQPYFLRPKIIILIFVSIIALENLFFITGYYLIPSSNFLANLISQSIVNLTNVNRLNSSLSQLKINPLLSQAAQLKANDMAQKGYFSHNSPENITPWDWFKKVGYDYLYAGENLAINFTDSEEVVNAWLNSESHRQNILNPNFTEIGIGIAKGNYQNQPAIFIVQMFGTPKKIAPLSSSKLETTPSKQIPTENIASKSPAIPTPQFTPISQTQPTPSKIMALNPTLEASLTQVGYKTLVYPFLQKIISNPKATINKILMILAIIILLALILKIFIRIKIQYPLLIANGILVLIVIFSASWINNFLFNVWSNII